MRKFKWKNKLNILKVWHNKMSNNQHELIEYKLYEANLIIFHYRAIQLYG